MTYDDYAFIVPAQNIDPSPCIIHKSREAYIFFCRAGLGAFGNAPLIVPQRGHTVIV